MRILFALPGLHRYDRGAEIAFISVARELSRAGETVTLIGSGPKRQGAPYRYIQASSTDRTRFERFPSLPLLRNEYAYEELTFVPSLLRRYRPEDYDITVTCSYPFTNWSLRGVGKPGSRPPHVFVTQNGDWPAQAKNSEYRYFGCEGLICTNPDYYERNKERWHCALIPNGADTRLFFPGPANRRDFGIPENRMVILVVSALIPSKRVDFAIQIASELPGVHLLVVGDGPLRNKIDAFAMQVMPGRYTRLTVPAERMPHLYRTADVFLHLAKEESFGNVFVEAMACGLPVVSHDTPRVRWIVGSEEFLVPDAGCETFPGQIKRAAREGPARRQARATTAADRFSWQKIATQYRSFFRDIAGV